MAVTTSNLIMGPGTLYFGDFGATEPADSAVASAPSASTWTDVGGTIGGVTLAVVQEYAEFEVDQLVDTPERRITKRETSLATSLAETTLENLVLSLNGGTVTASAGYSTYDPDTTTSVTQPDYHALLFDGFAPSSLRRRVLARKVLSIEGVEAPYKKDEQTVFPVKFANHFVSAAIKPMRIVDQTA
jgi:hypothetical protein